MPHQGGQASKRLDGWKEIAAHLGFSVRTVQTWERSNGLPVYRIPGSRGRVNADPEELTQWLRERDTEQRATEADPPEPASTSEALEAATTGLTAAERRRRRWLLGMGAAVLSVLGAVAWWGSAKSAPALFGYRVDADHLAGVDRRGRAVWSHALPGMPAFGDHGDRHSEAERLIRTGWVVDVDGDGTNELLYHYLPGDRHRESSVLICLRADGSVRWSFHPGRDVLTPLGRRFGGPYQIVTFERLRTPRPDGGRLVVSSHHDWSWPHQVAVLTAEGQVVAEYWHPGWMFAMAVADMDGDGLEEVRCSHLSRPKTALDKLVCGLLA